MIRAQLPEAHRAARFWLPGWRVSGERARALNKIKSPRRHFTFFVFYLAASQPIDFHSPLVDIQKASLQKNRHRPHSLCLRDAYRCNDNAKS
jgi:hypothetical protein